MTTIAYRDGVLAADSLVSAGGVAMSSVPKVWKTEDGHRWAFAGKMGFLAGCKAWTQTNREAEPPAITESTLVHISPSGYCRELTEQGWIEGQIAPFLAWGSGEQLAVGAMAAGATAVEAVTIACLHDLYSAQPVEVLEA